MLTRRAAIAAVAPVLLAGSVVGLASPASAADPTVTLSVTNHVLTVTAVPTGSSLVVNDGNITNTIVIGDGSTTVPTLPAGCSGYSADDNSSDNHFVVQCTTTGVSAVTSVVLVGGSGADELSGARVPVAHPLCPPGQVCPPPPPTTSSLSLPLTLQGAAGDDLLAAGSGVATIDGGGGDDVILNGIGADDDHGGTGFDTVSYASSSGTVSVTLDDAANDGITAEHDDVHTDVEHVIGGIGNDVLTGDDAVNILDGGPGNDILDGKGGADALIGGEGNDMITASDGAADQVDCGDGTDSATVDSIDSVTGCETVSPTPDADHDGYPAPADCNDANPAIHPGAKEIPGNQVDENCDGIAAPLQVLPTVVAGTFTPATNGKSTKVSVLTAYGATAGSTIHVACAVTKGCPIKAHDVVVTKSGNLDLRKALKLSTVKTGVALVLTVRNPNAFTKTYTFRILAKKQPTRGLACANPATGGKAACL